MGKRKVLVALYVLIILWITLFSRRPMESRIFRGLFWEIEMGYWNNIIQNILLFIPLGFLIGGKRGIIAGVLLSIGIELTQYIFRLGYCELDDVLNNTIGAAIGSLLFKKFGKVNARQIYLNNCIITHWRNGNVREVHKKVD